MYEAEVIQGVAILDRQTPDWRERIDWDNFDMQQNDTCVLSQLYDNIINGLVILGIPISSDEDIKCGFDVPSEDISSENYKKLTETWKKHKIGVSL